MSDIQVVEVEQTNLRGAFLINGFPSIGLVGSIVSNFLVGSLHLRPVAVIESAQFPMVSLVKDGIPTSPVRIHAGEVADGVKLAVLTSEFPPPLPTMKPLADTIMNWAESNQCRMIISPEGIARQQGLVPDASAPQPPAPPKDGPRQVLGVGATPAARELLKSKDVQIFDGGVIVGLSGVLLNSGVNRHFDVIALMTEATPELPDARAAAAIADVIGSLVLDGKLDTSPLFKEASLIEKGLRDMYEKAGAEAEPLGQVTVNNMYG